MFCLLGFRFRYCACGAVQSRVTSQGTLQDRRIVAPRQPPICIYCWCSLFRCYSQIVSSLLKARRRSLRVHSGIRSSTSALESVSCLVNRYRLLAAGCSKVVRQTVGIVWFLSLFSDRIALRWTCQDRQLNEDRMLLSFGQRKYRLPLLSEKQSKSRCANLWLWMCTDSLFFSPFWLSAPA
jgi:hypothetical protein